MKIRSALFRAYKEEPGSDVMDYLFGLMGSKNVIGLTSQLSVSEILRGIIKRKNQGEIPEQEAQKIIREKMNTMDIREKEALRNLKALIERDE